jgi:hypothetical protein
MPGALTFFFPKQGLDGYGYVLSAVSCICI